MVQEVRRTVFRHGLAFYGTLSFVASFFGARLFATLNPTVTVVRSGIHFHHFWYGLAMVVSTGWLGISLSNERLSRNLAIIFGLGAGLIGDEVGLLLTFGDYTSNLTEIFFVAAIAFVILATLLYKGRVYIQREVINLSREERLTQIGVFLGAFSVIFFAVGNWAIGLAFLGVGVVVYLWGEQRERRPRSLRSLAS
jgi:FtsH-binding integral membrane protein